MKNKIFVVLLCLTHSIFSENEPKILLAHKKNLRCTHLFGTSLDECLQEISNNLEYKENLTVLDKDQLENHFKRTLQKPEDYQKFFDKFSENDWNKFYNSLNTEMQNLLPKNKEEQKQLIAIMELNSQIYKKLIPSKKDLLWLGIGFGGGIVVCKYGGPMAKWIYEKVVVSSPISS